jgi:hypothetical protein
LRSAVFDWGSTFGWFDVLGLVLTLVGFIVAAVQSHSAKTAAEAAKEAAVVTERELAKSQLLVSLSNVQQIISDVESAASNENKAVAVFSLIRFGVAATEARELLDRATGDNKALQDSLKQSSERALDLKSALAKSASLKIARTSDPLRSELGLLNLNIQQTLTRVRFKTESGNNVH